MSMAKHAGSVALSRLIVAAMTFAGVFCLGFGDVQAKNTGASEYELKAAYLLNFARFIEWPPGNFETPADPLVIGVLGKDPFGKILERTFKGELVHGRAVIIRRARKPEDLPACHLVFISDSETSHLKTTLFRLAQSGLLTVSDIPKFTVAGGMISFTVQDQRLRFRVNQSAAERADLTISSKVLRLAVEVTDEDEGGS